MCSLSDVRVDDPHLSVLFISQFYAAAAEVLGLLVFPLVFKLESDIRVAVHHRTRLFKGVLWGVVGDR